MYFQIIAENGQKFYVNEDLPPIDADHADPLDGEAETQDRTLILTTNEGYDVTLQADGSYLIVDLGLSARKK